MATAFSLEKLGKADELVRAQAVSKGFPANAVRELLADRSVTMSDLARVIAPRRTIDRRLKLDTPFSEQESDRLARFARVLNEASRLFGSREKAMRWLTAPKSIFDDAVPIEMLRTEAGGEVIENLFLRASHGMLA